MKKMQKIQTNDILEGNFTLFIDGVEIPEYTKTTKITIGKNEYLENFDSYLINRKSFPNLEVKLTFPKSYRDENFAGKNALVKICDVKLTKSQNMLKKIEEDLINLNMRALKLSEINKSLQEQIEQKDKEIIASREAFMSKVQEMSAKADLELKRKKEENDEKLKEEKQKIKDFALQSFVEDFISPFNNFILAIKATENTDNQVLKNFIYGFKMIENQFINTLNSHNIELIIPNINEEFNPEFHYAIDFIESDEHENNSIAKLNSYGFKLNSRVIKPAVVTLYKKISN
ncbi:nucleotide exchange factor GrpE [Mycoplasma anserisalpingitidis]|uniref:Protein GrpE n=1 Tax=Mycoplasma anserisalpingitidis TaxID=519450 RepID=A0A5B8K227_9MOLU|nr:nucleotide exchange factor GrpE [Mycoplasma anserisalpingitidis]QDY88750.1 nucleotide exchange factor GrpE [Mycoplasma anserisalpingitidis]